MKISRVVIGESSEDTQVVLDDSYVLDGVISLTIHQEAGAPPRLILQLALKNVDIEQVA